MADRIIYKNHCTPQEKLAFAGGDRYYLDSDCGRKLTGVAESKVTGDDKIGTPVTGEFPATISLSSVKFIYVKNTDTSGSDYLLVNIGGMGAVIRLNYGESFASDVGDDSSDSTTVVVTAGSGTPSFEYIQGS
jgi:hypothetical protein